MTDYRPGPRALTPTQWLICAIAALGFAFDIYELLMLPLIVRPALVELGGLTPGSAGFNYWVGLLLYVPAACGGVFGLLGGYLADRLGRRRVLVWGILLYACSAFATGFSTSPAQFLVLRCLTWIGIAVEFVAAVAYVAEMFSDPRRREAALGYTLGGFLASGAYYVSVTYAESFPEIRGGHQAWRYALMSGLIPALPLIVVRPFLPESAIWKQKRAQGALQRLRVTVLFQPRFRRTTLITACLSACSFGIAMGGLQHVPRIVPGLPDVARLSPTQIEQAVSRVQLLQEAGGLAGRFLLAFLAVRIASRRRLLRVFQVPSLLFIPLALWLLSSSSLQVFTSAIFLAGLFTVGQFSFWGNYLPRVFPTQLRGERGRPHGRLDHSRADHTARQPHTRSRRSQPARRRCGAGCLSGLCSRGLAGSYFLEEPRQEQLPD